MSVEPEKLKQPEGELIVKHFPGIDLDSYLAKWIEQGEGLASNLSGAAQDQAVTAWAYYRARAWQWDNRRVSPAEMKTDAGRNSKKYSDPQLEEIRNERDRWLAEFNSLTGKGAQGSSVAVGQMRTATASCRFCGSLPYCVHTR